MRFKFKFWVGAGLPKPRQCLSDTLHLAVRSVTQSSFTPAFTGYIARFHAATASDSKLYVRLSPHTAPLLQRLFLNSVLQATRNGACIISTTSFHLVVLSSCRLLPLSAATIMQIETLNLHNRQD